MRTRPGFRACLRLCRARPCDCPCRQLPASETLRAHSDVTYLSSQEQLHALLGQAPSESLAGAAMLRRSIPAACRALVPRALTVSMYACSRRTC